MHNRIAQSGIVEGGEGLTAQLLQAVSGNAVRLLSTAGLGQEHVRIRLTSLLIGGAALVHKMAHDRNLILFGEVHPGQSRIGQRRTDDGSHVMLIHQQAIAVDTLLNIALAVHGHQFQLLAVDPALLIDLADSVLHTPGVSVAGLRGAAAEILNGADDDGVLIAAGAFAGVRRACLLVGGTAAGQHPQCGGSGKKNSETLFYFHSCFLLLRDFLRADFCKRN